MLAALSIATSAVHAAPPSMAARQPIVPLACFERSAARYSLDAKLLIGIARTESGMNPDALNRGNFKRTGTYGIGLMQVESGWLPTLAHYGIAERDLHDACTNIDVGAWILAGTVARHGNRWAAIGAYNAACTSLKGDACTTHRAAYAWNVYRRMGERAAADSASASSSVHRPPVSEFQMVAIGASGR